MDSVSDPKALLHEEEENHRHEEEVNNDDNHLIITTNHHIQNNNADGEAVEERIESTTSTAETRNADDDVMLPNPNSTATVSTSNVVLSLTNESDDENNRTPSLNIQGTNHNIYTSTNIINGDDRSRMMSRQSTLSSIAGNSIDFAGDDNVEIVNHIMMMVDNDDVDDLDTPLPEENDTLLDFLPNDPIESNADVNTNITTTNIMTMDERSIRSDRPDPPPSSDIPLIPMETHDDNDDHHQYETNRIELNDRTTTTNSNSNMESHHVNDDTVQRHHQILPQHRHVTTAEENFADQALASLSMNMAEMTLSEEQHHSKPDDKDGTGIANTEWDLNRAALLAETPNGVTIRKTASLHAMTTTPTTNPTDTTNMEKDQDVDHFHVDLNQKTMSYPNRSWSVPQMHTTNVVPPQVIGADHLMVLPRVDEGSRLLYNNHHLPHPHHNDPSDRKSVV